MFLERGLIGNVHVLTIVGLFALSRSRTSLCFYMSAVQVFFKNTVGKGEIAHNEQFLLFPQCFPPIWRTFCYFHQI